MKSIITVLALLLFGFGIYYFSFRESEAPSGPISVEATLVYEGILPAASSPGIETTLTLMDRGDGQGGGFTLVETFIGEEDGTSQTSGQWELRSSVIVADPSAQVYVLTSEEDPNFGTRYFELLSNTTIRQLDLEGNRIESDLPYNLELRG